MTQRPGKYPFWVCAGALAGVLAMQGPRGGILARVLAGILAGVHCSRTESQCNLLQFHALLQCIAISYYEMI